MKRDIVDEMIILAHQGSVRSLDCIVKIKTIHQVSVEQLKKGILSTQKKFPKTATHPIKILEKISLEQFSKTRLTSYDHLELLYISPQEIALKMSHALGDLVSMLLWLQNCLGIKTKSENKSEKLILKNFPAKKNTPFKYRLNSHVWPSQLHLSHKTDNKILYFFDFEHREIKRADFSLNDVFLLAFFNAIKLKRKSIWVPVNVRKNFSQGFGNGLSRMRIYPPGSNGPVLSQLGEIRKQKRLAYQNGEISLPPTNLKLSQWKQFLLKKWIHRPWADWCSLSFSHMDDKDHLFDWISEIQGISNIGPYNHLAIFAFSRGTRTIVSFSADHGVVSKEHLSELENEFKTQVWKVLDDITA